MSRTPGPHPALLTPTCGGAESIRSSSSQTWPLTRWQGLGKAGGHQEPGRGPPGTCPRGPRHGQPAHAAAGRRCPQPWRSPCGTSSGGGAEPRPQLPGPRPPSRGLGAQGWGPPLPAWGPAALGCHWTCGASGPSLPPGPCAAPALPGTWAGAHLAGAPGRAPPRTEPSQCPVSIIADSPPTERAKAVLPQSQSGPEGGAGMESSL